ncbi:MAG: hypothetical protein ACXVB6_20680, partial [Mucilaginibacter sp.]
VLGIDKIFLQADDNGNYLSGDAKLLDHIPAVMAALNLSADDIHEIMQKKGMENKLTLSNLSILYRYRLLSKVLGLRIPAFLSILPLYENYENMFQDANMTLTFMNRWAKMESSGFTYQQLNYIINDKDDVLNPLGPTEKTILQLSKTLYDGLNAIDEEHKDLKADDSISDPVLQKINILEQATSELVRTKVSLLFESDTVEKIMGILEGTNVYTNKAPKDLDFTLPDSSTLKKKLKYDKTLGSIQITGILTQQSTGQSEVDEYKAISNSSEWVKALACIQKQQEKLFKELLSGIFESEHTIPVAAKEKIMMGDIMIPFDKIPNGEEDPNTAPKKRAVFLEVFLPYLRQQLSHRFVIDTLANFIELGSKVTNVLVSEVLKLDSSDKPIYSIFEKIKESSKPDEANWSGYLIPSADANYTFIIKNSVTKPSVSIDGVVLDFLDQKDPTNECQDDQNKEWWSGTIQLQGGKLYKLVVDGLEFKNIFWKTPTTAIAAIPSSALIPDFASRECEPALIVLKKAAMLVSTFDLSADEIRFFDLHKTEFDNLNFNAPKLKPWLRLEAYIRLRNSLPQAKLSMLDFWNWIYKAKPDETELIGKIVDLTTWKEERIKKLIAVNHFNIGNPEDYRNEKNLLKLQETLTVADKIGIDIDLLFEWAVPVSKFSTCRKIADSIKHAIRAKYNQTDWEQVVK